MHGTFFFLQGTLHFQTPPGRLTSCPPDGALTEASCLFAAPTSAPSSAVIRVSWKSPAAWKLEVAGDLIHLLLSRTSTVIIYVYIYICILMMFIQWDKMG